MGFRFRKTISIVPGVRVNLSNGGASLSLGPRGASISVGKRGTYANLGLPGTGLSYRTRLDGGRSATRSANRSDSQVETIDIDSLEREALLINGDMDSILNIHELTPNINTGRTWSSLEQTYIDLFDKPYSVLPPERPVKPETLVPPQQPERIKPGFFAKLLKSDDDIEQEFQMRLQLWNEEVTRCERDNQLNQLRYQQQRTAWAEQYAQWTSDKKVHEERTNIPREQIIQAFNADNTFFEHVLAHDLADIEWPRETIISYQVDVRRSLVQLDVDLPEIEDIPSKTASINARQNGLNIKNKTEKTLRQEYARHIHGCMFKLIGETFASLPLNNVQVAGYSQRVSKTTGNIENEYLLSVIADRVTFSRINFDNLSLVDPVESLCSYSLNRNMSSTGIFKPIVL